MIELDLAVVTLLAGSVMPLLTAVVAKLGASSTVKAVLNVVLSAAAGCLAVLVAGDGAASWDELVTAAIGAYLASGVSYTNLWKPTGAAMAVSARTADVGLGSNEELLEWDAAVKDLETYANINTTDNLSKDYDFPAQEKVTVLDPNTAPRITTLRGHAVYSDPSGYLWVEEAGV